MIMEDMSIGDLIIGAIFMAPLLLAIWWNKKSDKKDGK